MQNLWSFSPEAKISKLYFIVNEDQISRNQAARAIARRYRRGLYKIWERFSTDSQRSIMDEDHDVEIIADPALCEESFRSKILTFLKTLQVSPETEWVVAEKKPSQILDESADITPDATSGDAKIYIVQDGADLALILQALTGRSRYPYDWTYPETRTVEDFDQMRLARWKSTGVMTKYYLIDFGQGSPWLLGQRGKVLFWANCPVGEDISKAPGIPLEDLPEHTPKPVQHHKRMKQLEKLVNDEDEPGLRQFLYETDSEILREYIKGHVPALFGDRFYALKILFQIEPESVKEALGRNYIEKIGLTSQILDFAVRSLETPWGDILRSYQFKNLIYDTLAQSDVSGFEYLTTLARETANGDERVELFSSALSLMMWVSSDPILDVLTKHIRGDRWLLRFLPTIFTPADNYPAWGSFSDIYLKLVHKQFPISEIDEAFGGSVLQAAIEAFSKSPSVTWGRDFDKLFEWINRVLDEHPVLYSDSDLNWIGSLTLITALVPRSDVLSLMIDLIRRLKSEGFNFSPERKIPYTNLLRTLRKDKETGWADIYAMLIRDERVRMGTLLTNDDDLSESRLHEARTAREDINQPVLFKQNDRYRVYKIGTEKSLHVLANTFTSIRTWGSFNSYNNNPFKVCYYVIKDTHASQDEALMLRVFTYQKILTELRPDSTGPFTTNSSDTQDYLSRIGFDLDDFPFFTPSEDPLVTKARDQQKHVLDLLQEGTDTDTLIRALRGVRGENWALHESPLTRAIISEAPAEQVILLVKRGFAKTADTQVPKSTIFTSVPNTQVLKLLRKTRYWDDVLLSIDLSTEKKEIIRMMRDQQQKAPNLDLLRAQLGELFNDKYHRVYPCHVLSLLATKKATRDMIYQFFASLVEKGKTFWSDQLINQPDPPDPDFIIYLHERGLQIGSPKWILYNTKREWLSKGDSLRADQAYLRRLQWWISAFPDQMDPQILAVYGIGMQSSLKTPVADVVYSIIVKYLTENPSWWSDAIGPTSQTMLQLLLSHEAWFSTVSNPAEKYVSLIRQGRTAAGTYLTQDDSLDENRRRRK